MYAILKLSSDKPYGTPMERLISCFFFSKEDVSFIYVIHGTKSGFVTYRRNGYNTALDNTQRENEDTMFVYKDEVVSLR